MATTIKPKKITDIVYKMGEYLQMMRGMECEDAMNFVNNLENYIKKYFSDSKINELKLKNETVEMVDELYIQLMELKVRDVYIDGYFGIILNRLFYELARKKIYAFFIIDNTIRDDRFKLLVELFITAHFEVIYPYNIEIIKYSQNYTRHAIRDFHEIEHQINEAKKQKKHILYVEKDDSVNYLANVLQIGEEFQNKYICIFRNESIKEYKNAIWLMGSFSGILKSRKPKSLEEINEWSKQASKK